MSGLPVVARLSLGLLVFIVCILLPGRASASPEGLRQAVDSAYAKGQYEQVELMVLRAQAQINELPVADRSAINVTAGCAMIMLEREADARVYFRNALEADPTLHLDPVRVSPKFRVVFDDVKASFRADENSSAKAQITSPLLQGPRPSSVLINLLLPGAGQWNEERKLKGAAFFLTQSATVAAMIWRLDVLDKSRHTYVRERNAALVTSDYNRYARDMPTAWYAGIATGIVYLAAQADLALGRRPVRLAEPPVSLINCTPLGDGLAVQWSIRW